MGGIKRRLTVTPCLTTVTSLSFALLNWVPVGFLETVSRAASSCFWMSMFFLIPLERSVCALVQVVARGSKDGTMGVASASVDRRAMQKKEKFENCMLENWGGVS